MSDNEMNVSVSDTEPVKTKRPGRKKAEAAAEIKTAAETAAEAAEAKKPAARKAAGEKKTAAAGEKKTAAAEKTDGAAKTAARKTAGRKAGDSRDTVYIQFAGREVIAKNVLAAAKEAFARDNEGVEIKTIELYVKPEEGFAYYVVNGIGGDDMKVQL